MQLFTHLLSSYLQGMGDFFSALPWGGLGRGFWLAGAGLTLNTIIPASTWTDGNDLWVNYEKCIDAAMLNSILGECSFQRNALVAIL